MAAKNKAERTGYLLVVCGMLLILGSLVLLWMNIQEADAAGEAAGRAMNDVRHYINTVQAEAADSTPAVPSVQELFSEPEQPQMPAVEVQGNVYIGTLQFPSLGLELPVMDECNTQNMQNTPCRYAGSVETDDLVICGHNYRTTFGRLRRLNRGDSVVFTAMDGTVYRYAVVELEVLEPEEIDRMIHSEFDLSLYTCTYYGRQRLTVRCKRL